MVFTKKNTHTHMPKKKNLLYLRHIDSMKKDLMTSLNDIGAVPHEHRSTGKKTMHWNISAFIMQLLLLSIRLPKYVYHNLTSQEKAMESPYIPLIIRHKEMYSREIRRFMWRYICFHAKDFIFWRSLAEMCALYIVLANIEIMFAKNAIVLESRSSML